MLCKYFRLINSLIPLSCFWCPTEQTAAALHGTPGAPGLPPHHMPSHGGAARSLGPGAGSTDSVAQSVDATRRWALWRRCGRWTSGVLAKLGDTGWKVPKSWGTLWARPGDPAAKGFYVVAVPWPSQAVAQMVTVTSLDLRFNGMGDDGAKAPCDSGLHSVL